MSRLSTTLPAVLTLLLAACGSHEVPKKAPRLVVVEAPQPYSGDGGLEALPGTIRARNEADLSFRIDGKIARRVVELGTHVEAGALIAELDPQDARLNRKAAESDLEAAEADYRLAKREAERYRDLHARGYVGQSALDSRVNALRLADARREQARSRLDLAQNQTRYTRLTADAPGVITRIFAEPGNVVTSGQPVVHFAADGEREVSVSVPEGGVDALRRAAGLGIGIYSQPGVRYAGRLRDVTPQADRETRTHEARVTLVDAPPDVPLGASATVYVVAPTDAQTFVLPATALGATDAKQPLVWKVVEGEDGGAKAQAVEVQVLRYLDGKVIVTGPIDPQDALITAGVNLLTPDMAVTAVRRSAKAAL